MAQACWQGSADGRYWIDAALGTLDMALMIDLGLVDSRNLVGFSVEPSLFDQLKLAGALTQMQMHSRLDASGRISQSESGLLGSQLICPVDRRRVGPVVQLYVLRGNPGVPNRFGVAFFHHLVGCRVLWNLDTRTWCVDYP